MAPVNPLENHLIAALPSTDRRRLLAAAKLVKLDQAQLLCEAGKPTLHAYFPNCAVISLVARIGDQRGLEVGVVGREGMFGVQLALGVRSTHLRAVVKVPGTAWSVSAPHLQQELDRGKALRCGLDGYVYMHMKQLAAAAFCQHFHSISPRLASCLLMSQDRADTDRFAATHEFLAHLLGVRRVGITEALGAMQRNGLVQYHRGKITVLDHNGLQAIACDCYAVDRQSCAELVKERTAA